jgi:hypothetical protein
MVIPAEKILNRKSGGLGSLIGATQATEAAKGENFLTGQALAGLDRWGMAFQGISAASGVAAVGLCIAGIDSPLDFGGWFRTAAAESATPFRQIMANLQRMDFSTAPKYGRVLFRRGIQRNGAGVCGREWPYDNCEHRRREISQLLRRPLRYK